MVNAVINCMGVAVGERVRESRELLTPYFLATFISMPLERDCLLLPVASCEFRLACDRDPLLLSLQISAASKT